MDAPGLDDAAPAAPSVSQHGITRMDPQRRDRSTSEPSAEQPLSARIEALLLTTDRPLAASRLAELTGADPAPSEDAITEAITTLNDQYEHSGRSFRVERLAGGYQILTLPAFGPLLARLHTERQHSRLSPAALETLAIVAYRQPLMRAEIEAIRGVACGEVLRGLLDRRLVKIVGRADELGRPMLYGTTREFLNVFGLATLDDLPEVEGLKREASHQAPRRSTPSKEGTTRREAEAATKATDASGDAAPAD